jgi:hypothetical protein
MKSSILFLFKGIIDKIIDKKWGSVARYLYRR